MEGGFRLGIEIGAELVCKHNSNCWKYFEKSKTSGSKLCRVLFAGINVKEETDGLSAHVEAEIEARDVLWKLERTW